jgi:hypothetical protein
MYSGSLPWVGAVVEGAGVAGGDPAAPLECLWQLGELFERRAGARAVVLRDLVALVV